jgi:oxidase EvaA
MKQDKYLKQLNKYKKHILGLNMTSKIDENQLEFHFETLKDWSTFHTFEDIEKWYQSVLDKKEMVIEEISLKDCSEWIFDGDIIYHTSGEFYSVQALRVHTKIREAKRGWDQPLFKQVGLDGGILGIVRKRFEGIPHYLLEAKSEPGNVNLVQISPTLQATFSNINAAHLGNVPNYLNIFQNAEKVGKVLLKKWQSEDGGRFYSKRNLNMIVEVEEDYNITFKTDNFIWMSMYQIKQCLEKESWVANSVRTIISHV